MAAIVANSYPTSRCGPIPSGARTNTQQAREQTRGGHENEHAAGARLEHRNAVHPSFPRADSSRPWVVASPGGSLPFGRSPSCGPVGLARRPDRARLRPLSRLALADSGPRLLGPFKRVPSILATPPRRHDGLLPRRLILKTTDCDPVQGDPPRFGQAPCAGHDRAQCGASDIRRRARNRAPNRWGPSSSASRLKSSGSAPATICLHRATIRDSLARTAASTALPVQRERRRAPRCQCNANGGERRAASATRTAASTAQPVQRERRRAPRCQRNANGGEHRAASATRTAASTAQPAQRERRRAPRCQRNANGGEHRAASATQTAASTALPAQRERRRAPRSQCNANGGEHRAASATRTAASTALPAQRKRRRAPRSQRNANGGEHRAASATQTAASAALPTQRERRRALRCQRNANGSKYYAGRTTGASRGVT